MKHTLKLVMLSLLVALFACGTLTLALPARAAEEQTAVLPKEGTAPAKIERVLSRPEANQINLGLEFDVATMGKAEGIDADANGGAAYRGALWINGKSIGNWPDGSISIHANLDDWAPLMCDGETGEKRDDTAADTSKFWLHIGFPKQQLNFVGDGTDVLTVKSSFPTGAIGDNPPAPDRLLDRDYNLLIKPLVEEGVNKGYTFEEIDTVDKVTQRKSLFPKIADLGENANYAIGNEVNTSYKEGGYSFRAKDNGEIMLVTDDAHRADASGWDKAHNKINLEMWIYTAKPSADFKDLGNAIELSSGSAADDASEYEWNASDIYFHKNYVQGMWNRVVFKISEPRDNRPATQPDFTNIGYFRHYYLYAEDKVNGVYFSDIALIESPTNAGVIEQRKVLQYIDFAPRTENPQTGETFTLGAVDTRLEGASGRTDTLTFVSSDPEVLRIEGDQATVLKEGDVTVTAKVEGDAQYQEATAEQSYHCVKVLKPQAALTIDSAAQHLYGTDYIFVSSGGSGAGAVSFAIVPEGTTGTATIEGSALKITKSGVFKIKARKAADDDYLGVESEVFTLTVDKRAITVKVDDAEIKEGGILPRFRVSLTDGTLAEGEQLSAVVAFVFDSSAADAAVPGEYDITATYTSDNYTVTVNKGTLTVASKTPPPTDNGGKKGCGTIGLSGGSSGGGGALFLAALALGTAAALTLGKRTKKSVR